MPPSLFFSDSDLQLMRETLHREPLNSAARLLDAPPADGLAKAHLLALRFVLRGEVEAGESALAALRHKDTGKSESALAATKQAFGRLSALAMLRDLPGCQDALDNEIGRLPTESDSGDLLESLWAAVLRMAAGILRDAESDIASAAEMYRRAIDAHIHPEGYIRGIVDIERKDNGRDSDEGQLSATCALALIAEMAAQRDIDLWGYSQRAVSIHTAAAYTHYYYHYPERWRWGAGLTRGQVEAAMRREGAFYELVNRQQPPRGIDALFAEQRPFFCVWAGGLTTLTHAAPRPKERRWKLW